MSKRLKILSLSLLSRVSADNPATPLGGSLLLNMTQGGRGASTRCSRAPRPRTTTAAAVVASHPGSDHQPTRRLRRYVSLSVPSSHQSSQQLSAAGSAGGVFGGSPRVSPRLLRKLHAVKAGISFVNNLKLGGGE